MSNQNLETALNTLKFLHPNGGVFELCLINPLSTISPNWAGKAFGKKPIVAGWFSPVITTPIPYLGHGDNGERPGAAILER